MSCELFDHLKTMNFSSEPRCVYEANCPFAKSRNINLIEVAESCQAISDEQKSNAITEEDLLQENEIQSLISTSRVN